MKQDYPLYVKLTIGLVGTLAFFVILYLASNILIPIALSIILAIVLFPVFSYLKHIGLHELLSIIISIILLFLLLTGIVTLVGMQLTEFTADAPALAKKLEQVFQRIQSFVERQFEIEQQVQLEYVKNMSSDFLKSDMTSVVSTTLNRASNLLIMMGLIPVYTFFFLYYRNLFKEFFIRIAPDVEETKMETIFHNAVKVIQDYIGGIVTVMLILAILNSGALLIIGIDYAIFFGVVAALLTIIPYIGVFIGMTLPIVYSLIAYDSLWPAIFVWTSFQIIQFVEGNFITPNIIGSNVKLSPLFVIVVLFIGGLVWGAAGMILFVPYLAMIKIVISNFENMQPLTKLLSGYNRDDQDTFLKEAYNKIFKKNNR